MCIAHFSHQLVWAVQESVALTPSPQIAIALANMHAGAGNCETALLVLDRVSERSGTDSAVACADVFKVAMLLRGASSASTDLAPRAPSGKRKRPRASAGDAVAAPTFKRLRAGDGAGDGAGGDQRRSPAPGRRARAESGGSSASCDPRLSSHDLVAVLKVRSCWLC